jgi:glycosyltransferase involved in cell wall biosynthesis
MQSTESMQVAHVTPSMSYKGGGVSIALRELVWHQAELGLAVTLMSLKDQHEEHDAVHHERIECCTGTAFGPRALGYSADLKRILFDNHTANIVHCHGLWMYPSLLAREFAAKRNIPLVMSPHGMIDSWAMKNSAWKKKIAGFLYENRNLRSAACLHALSESEYQSIRNYGLKNPVCIIPNGIDLPNTTDAKVAPPWKPQVDADKNVLLFLGRIHPKKGLENLIKAWGVLKTSKLAELKNWHLVIAGWSQGGHEGKLKQLVTELNLDADVTFAGPLYDTEKDAALRAAKAFVLPSFSEGLPMAVLEAWSYGLPVLMTKFCNIPEGFETNAAIEIQPEPDSIAEGLKGFVALSENQQKQIGRNGLELVEDKFAWPKIAAQMVDVYRWVLGQGDKPDCVRLN